MNQEEIESERLKKDNVTKALKAFLENASPEKLDGFDKMLDAFAGKHFPDLLSQWEKNDADRRDE